MTVKDDSELQHVLAHLWLALEHLAKGENKATLYELDSVAGLIFFDDDAQRVDYLEAVNYGEETTEKTEPLPEPLPQPETEEADKSDAGIG